MTRAIVHDWAAGWRGWYRPRLQTPELRVSNLRQTALAGKVDQAQTAMRRVRELAAAMIRAAVASPGRSRSAFSPQAIASSYLPA